MPGKYKAGAIKHQWKMDNTISRIGFWVGIFAFGSTIAFDVVQMLQLFAVLRYPWDEMLIYGFSLGIVLPFLLEILALHYVAPAEKKFWSHAALIFAILYAVFVTANYVVQLTTVIPMSLHGAAGDVQVLRQTPHSFFWDFDAIGYICMGFVTLFALPVFEKQGPQRWVKRVFLAHGLVTPLIAFVYFYPTFSNDLLLLAVPWGVTAPLSMLLLAVLFRQNEE